MKVFPITYNDKIFFYQDSYVVPYQDGKFLIQIETRGWCTNDTDDLKNHIYLVGTELTKVLTKKTDLPDGTDCLYDPSLSYCNDKLFAIKVEIRNRNYFTYFDILTKEKIKDPGIFCPPIRERYSLIKSKNKGIICPRIHRHERLLKFFLSGDYKDNQIIIFDFYEEQFTKRIIELSNSAVIGSACIAEDGLTACVVVHYLNDKRTPEVIIIDLE